MKKYAYFCSQNFQQQDKKMREAVVKAHNVECDFYTRFAGVDGVPIPEVWYTRKLDENLSQPGVIMMEDLSDVAHTGGMVASINLVQVSGSSSAY